MLKAAECVQGLDVTEYVGDSQPNRQFFLKSIDELIAYCHRQGLELESFQNGVMNPVLGKSKGSSGR